MITCLAPRRPRAARAALLLSALLALAGCDASRPADPASAAPAADRALPVRIVAFNDFHGQLSADGLTLRLADPSSPGATLQVGAGGVAYLATRVRQLRAEVAHSVVVSGGDLVGASPIGSALFRDEPTIEAMNALGLDLGVVGNHEFDRGFAELQRLAGGGCHPGDATPWVASCAGDGARFTGAAFPMIGANVTKADGGPALPASVVRDFGGRRVAFVGAVVRGTPAIVMPAGVAGLRFEDEADAINREVVRLRREQGIEAFVAVIHEGGVTDGDWNDPACPGARGPIFTIADRLRPEVDVVLSGHTHQGYSCVRDAPGNPGLRVVQAVANGRAVSVVDLAIDPVTGDVDRARTRARNLPVPNGLAGDRRADAHFPPVPPDPRVQAIVAQYIERAAPLAGREVGRLAGPAARASSPGGDSALGRLVADAHLAATRDPARGGARLALTNPGGLRADLGCPASPQPCAIRFGEAFAAQPFGNSLVVMTLTGEQLLAALEQQFTGVNAQRARMLQPSAGFGFTWRASAPPGRRIVEARLDGVPIAREARYRVTVNSFLAEGGDGFSAFTGGVERLGGAQDIDALVAYLAASDRATQPTAAARVLRVE